MQAIHGTSTPTTATGLTTAIIDLEAGEYFTNISGTMLTSASGPVCCIASLAFTTNKRLFGPFGVLTTEKPFVVQGPVYAFHGAVTRGYTTDILTAIGVWKVPLGKQVGTG
jgi:hypothetical protein